MSTPRAVWLITALNLLVVVGWTVLVPSFRAPDENMHVDLVRRVMLHSGYPAYDEQHLSEQVNDARNSNPAYVTKTPPVHESQAAPRRDRPSFEQAGPDRPTQFVNPLPQHPPLYYAAAAGAEAAVTSLLPTDLWPFDREIAVVRLFDALLLLPLPWLAWATARRLGASREVGLVAAIAIVTIPTLSHIGASVNNDDLLFLLGAIAMWLGTRLLTGDRGWPTVLGASAAVGLACFTKGFGLVFAPWIVLALVLAPGALERWRPLLARVAAMVAVVTALGAWWWVRNVIVYGKVQPGVRLRPRSSTPVHPDVVHFVPRFLGRLAASFWGMFGASETQIGWPLVAVATTLALGALVVGVLSARRLADRLQAVVLLLPAAGLGLMVLSSAWGAYKKTGTAYTSQGRYLMAGLVGLVVVAALGWGRLAGTRQRWLPAATLAAAIVMQIAGAFVVIRRYWAGAGLDRIAALAAYSPWPQGVLLGVTAALAAVLALTAWDLARPATETAP